jgi:inhibitor of KinA
MEIQYFLTHEKLVEFSWPPIISEEILLELEKVTVYLKEVYGEGIKEIRKGYNILSLRLYVSISEQDCRDLIKEFKKLPQNDTIPTAITWRLPLVYGGEEGKDLVKLARIHDMDPEEIIQRHSNSVYRLYFYGFLPGFMYLGGMDPKLYTPRKESPERIISKGTVAIGGHQTGIYPMDSPGGWHAIGKCPVNFFDIKSNPPVLIQTGDCIRFVPIESQAFEEIRNLSSQGKYHLTHD